MKMNDTCLTCIVNQAVKIAAMTGMKEKEHLYQHVFRYLSETSYDRTAPEVTGDLYKIICAETGCDDPYRDVKRYYNQLMLDRLDEFRSQVTSLEDAVKYAIAGNIIDVSPAHGNVDDSIRKCFQQVREKKLTVNDVPLLEQELKSAKNVLYVCDNCGEIVLDRLLAEKMKRMYPQIKITFVVRGAAILNDATTEDARMCGLMQAGRVIGNGDWIQGTMPERGSEELRKAYGEADVVIAKGQANLECLSADRAGQEDADAADSDTGKTIYFLLMAKCDFIANWLNVEKMSTVCIREKRNH